MNREIRRIKNQKKLLEILKEPDERLRAENRVVGDVKAPGLKELITNMIYTIHRVDGVGLAAPQIGQNIKLAIAIIGRQPLVMFNPVITDFDEQQDTISIKESCLSCPGKEVEVPRFNDIIVRYDNISGNSVEIRAIGIDAIVLQHEIDHLNTKLIIDYITAKKKRRTKKKSE